MKVSLEDFLKAGIHYFSKQPDIAFVYLFGSSAKKRTTPRSDIDLAVYLIPSEKNSDVESRFDQIYHELNRLSPPASLDLIDLNKTPPYLAYEILKEGDLFFCKEESLKISFIAKTLRDYFDRSHARELYFKKMAERIEEGKFGHF